MGHLLPIHRGIRCSLWWVGDSCKFRGQEYFDGLKTKDRAKFDALFQRLADTGEIKNYEHFRKEEGDIYCFKRGQHRLASFQDGADWFISNGFRKKDDRDKRQKRHVEVAMRIRTQHLSETQRNK
jgi:hypothetical protein